MPYVQSQPWTRFRSAHVENSLCCPSRATILTGQYDTHTGVGNNAQAGRLDDRETLPVWLKRAGYRTGMFGKYFNFYNGTFVPPGWDQWHVPVGAMYGQYNYDLSTNGATARRGTAPADYQVDLLAARVSTFIAANGGRPFFAYYAPTATHAPFVASPTRRGAFAAAVVPHGADFNEADVTDKPAYIRQRPLLDPAVQDAHHRAQWEASLSIDDAIRRIDQALTTAGVRGRTVVIFTSDNGYAFGSHRWDHKRCQYDACSSVPLLVRYPGQPARAEHRLVSNVDLASTVTHLAGTTPAIRQDGRSLLPLILGRPVAWRTAVLTHWPGGDGNGQTGNPNVIPQWWGVRTPTAKYVELDTGEREYYDLVADPRELQNRAGHPAYAGRVAALRDRLAGMKASAGAAVVFPHNPAMPVAGPVGVDLD